MKKPVPTILCLGLAIFFTSYAGALPVTSEPLPQQGLNCIYSRVQLDKPVTPPPNYAALFGDLRIQAVPVAADTIEFRYESERWSRPLDHRSLFSTAYGRTDATTPPEIEALGGFQLKQISFSRRTDTKKWNAWLRAYRWDRSSVPGSPDYVIFNCEE